MTEFNAPLCVEEVSPAPVGPRQPLVRIAASGLCLLGVGSFADHAVVDERALDGLAAIERGEVIRSVIVN
jgi:hypothetical protein